jgi:hypothetical protein
LGNVLIWLFAAILGLIVVLVVGADLKHQPRLGNLKNANLVAEIRSVGIRSFKDILVRHPTIEKQPRLSRVNLLDNCMFNFQLGRIGFAFGRERCEKQSLVSSLVRKWIILWETRSSWIPLIIDAYFTDMCRGVSGVFDGETKIPFIVNFDHLQIKHGKCNVCTLYSLQ